MARAIRPSDFRVATGRKVSLRRRPTRIAPPYASDAEYRARLAAGTKRLGELQPLLYADNRYALLLIFQAMDTAGKDGVIRHVMSGINPQGCQVFSFKHPSAEELDHDFLWRTTRALPERGRIGIFNRSYYEEVLVVRVNPDILKAQNLPPSAQGPTIWRERYRSMRGFEQHLHRNGTRVVKIFLHLSRDEQKKRLIARIDDPEKNWKFSEGDVEQRRHWDAYMKAYEDCLSNTSTGDAPWYIVPADDKKTARLIVSQIVVETLSRLDLAYPAVSKARREQLRAIRRLLEEES